MFLKRIELFGFKSFAEKCTIDFSEDISVIVGPNGCGKSNVVDAIRWVLGAQNAKAMRADKMASVIFNGNKDRAPLSVAQVTLVVSNTDNVLPLEFSEVAIKRRVYRNGNSEYYINDTQVSLKELRAVFYDTGISVSEYLVLEQGKIDQILLAKPEDRRKILEEAAGISKFRISSQEGMQRLEKVETNITQLEQVFHEVVQRYDTLKVQVEKAKRHKHLKESVFLCNVAMSCKQYHSLEKESSNIAIGMQKKQQKKQEAEKVLQSLIENDEQIGTELKKQEKTIISHQNVLMEMQAEKRVLQGHINSLEKNKEDHKVRIIHFEQQMQLQQNRIKDMHASLEAYQKEVKEQERSVNSTKKQIEQLQQRESDAKNRIESLKVKKETLIQKEAESRDAIAKLQKELRKVVDTLAEELDKHTRVGHSLSVQDKKQQELQVQLQRLVHKAQVLTEKISDSSLVKENMNTAVFLEEMRAVYEQTKKTHDDFLAFCSVLPNFLYDFVKEEGVLSRKHTIDDSIHREQSNLAQNADEQRLINESLIKLDSERASLVETIQDCKVKLGTYTQAQKYSHEQIQRSSLDIKQGDSLLQSIRGQHTREKELLESLLVEKDTYKEKIQNITETEKQTNKQIEIVQSKIGSQSEHLIAFKNKISKQEELISSLRDMVYDTQSKKDRVDMKMQLLKENFYSAHGVQLHSYLAKGENIAGIKKERQQLTKEIEQYKSELQKLGSVNLLAAEEFSEVEERRNFLEKQLDDLKKSQEHLQTVLSDIHIESEKKLKKAYNEVRKEFSSLFSKVMGGGKADIVFSDEANILQSGLEIIAQPGNKKTQMLSQLSGGERAMTAIILIFALYTVKPAPFCVLDEIDAPLDDSNIDRLVMLLKNYVQKIQFLIISHNKRTIVHAKNIIGVTMEEMGVSSLIHVRVDDEKKDKKK